jgi:hypothetical protein
MRCRCTPDLSNLRFDLPHALAGNGQLTSEILQLGGLRSRCAQHAAPRGQHIERRTERFRLCALSSCSATIASAFDV